MQQERLNKYNPKAESHKPKTNKKSIELANQKIQKKMKQNQTYADYLISKG